MVRTFIALELCGEIRDTLKEAQQVLRGCSAGLTFVDPALIHITVKFLGEVDGKKLVQVQDVLKTLSFTPFRVMAGLVTVNNPKRPHTVWCTIDDGGNGQQLLGLIEAGLSPLGFAREDRRFTPHATVARSSPRTPPSSPRWTSSAADLSQLDDQRHETQEEHPDPPGAGGRGPARGEMVKRLPLEETVLVSLRPTQAEKDHVCGIAERVLELISRSGKAEGMIVGSVARHTWVRGDRDLAIRMYEAKKKGLRLFPWSETRIYHTRGEQCC